MMRFRHTVILAFLCLSANAEDLNEQQFIDKAMKESKQGNYAEAVSMLTKRIKHKEWQLQFLYRLRAADYSNLKEYEKARDDYIQALPRSKNGEVELWLGRTYEKLKDPSLAIFYLDKSIELVGENDLQNAFAHYYKGRALSSLGKFSEAKEILLKIEPNETTKGIMDEVQIVLDFCIEKEKQFAAMMAQHNDAEGQYIFGRLYAGYGNYEEAVQWYMKAAKRGHVGAQNKLAFCYRDGQGVDKNIIEAYAWALRAAKNGQVEAKDTMEGNLTINQLNAAQVRTKELAKGSARKRRLKPAEK